jgi:hypothetical protein
MKAQSFFGVGPKKETGVGVRQAGVKINKHKNEVHKEKTTAEYRQGRTAPLKGEK